MRLLAQGRRVELGARTLLIGDPDAVLAKVKAFQEAGAEHVCAYFGSTLEDFVPAMRAVMADQGLNTDFQNLQPLMRGLCPIV